MFDSILGQKVLLGKTTIESCQVQVT